MEILRSFETLNRQSRHLETMNGACNRIVKWFGYKNLEWRLRRVRIKGWRKDGFTLHHSTQIDSLPHFYMISILSSFQIGEKGRSIQNMFIRSGSWISVSPFMSEKNSLRRKWNNKSLLFLLSLHFKIKASQWNLLSNEHIYFPVQHFNPSALSSLS